MSLRSLFLLLLALCCAWGCPKPLTAPDSLPEYGPGARPDGFPSSGLDEAAVLRRIWQLQDGRAGRDELVNLLGHSEPSVRAAACRALGHLRELAPYRPLIYRLEDPEPSVRAAASMALGQVWTWVMGDIDRLGVEGEIEASLVGRLGLEEAPAVRAAIATSLGHLQGTQPVLLPLLQDPEAAVRRASVVALLHQARRSGERFLTPEVAAPLLPLLYRSEPARLPALLLLGGRELAPEAQALRGPLAGALAPLVRAEAGPGVLGPAARALARISGEAALPQILEVHAEVSEPTERVQLLRALSLLPSQGTHEALRVSLLSENAGVTTAAASLLAGGYCPARPAPLDPDWGAATVQALREAVDLAWSEEQALPSLPSLLVALGSCGEGEGRNPPLDLAIRAALDTDPAVRAVAPGLLTMAQADEAAAALAALMADADRGVRLAAAFAVSQRRQPADLGPLLALLEGDDLLLAAVAAEPVAFIRGPGAASDLVELFERASGPAGADARQAAVEASVALDQDGLEAFLGRAASDPAPAVRDIARKALLDRGLPAPVPASVLSPALPVSLPTQAELLLDGGAVIQLELWPTTAPYTVLRFAELAEEGFFDGLRFHRLVPAFVAQAGDPSGSGWGGSGQGQRTVLNQQPFGAGTLGMARSGLDTEDSQFFLTLVATPHLDGLYTSFGRVASGGEHLATIHPGQVIESIRVR